jgi:hypothetical protein
MSAAGPEGRFCKRKVGAILVIGHTTSQPPRYRADSVAAQHRADRSMTVFARTARLSTE